MTNDPIYLDHNATTPLLPEVVDAMLPYLREHFGNPSIGYVYGARAREALARAREQVAALLTVMHSNDETGVVQPVEELTRSSLTRCRRRDQSARAAHDISTLS